MALHIGPILNLRKSNPDSWDISILVGTSDADTANPVFTGGGVVVSGEETLLEYNGVHIFRHDFSIPLEDDAKNIEYSIGDETWQFTLPGKDDRPQSVFVSCNGFSSAKEAKNVDEKFAMWTRLIRAHADKEPNEKYNLMIMGGDQVYADEIWTKCTEVAKWSEKPVDKRRNASFNQAMARQVERFYFDLYCERWMQEPLRTALASIPTTMMWDDHDIFDGWGSYEKDDHECPVYQGIFNMAKRHFRVFQQQLPGDEGDHHPSNTGESGYSNFHEFEKIAILTLDARSQRTLKQVIAPEDWDAIYARLDGLAEGDFEHIFLVAPVPVVHADFALLEKYGDWILQKTHLEDDLRDHWQNADHRIERLRLIHRLFSLVETTRAKVTILSGDVHVACCGQLDKKIDGKDLLTIDQLTSSGIVHPAPPGLMGWMLEQLSTHAEPVDQGIEAKMNEFPSLRRKYLLDRNFLSIEPDDKGRIWANWIVEGIDSYVTKVIQKMPDRSS